MPGTKKPRRAYKSRPKAAMAAFTVLTQKRDANYIERHYFVPLEADEQRDEALVYSAALGAFAMGIGTREHAMRLGTMCNQAMILCEMGFGKEYEKTCIEAVDGVFRVGLRYRVDGDWRMDEAGFRAVALAYEVFCGQMKVAGQGHFRDARREVARRESAGDYHIAKRTEPGAQPGDGKGAAAVPDNKQRPTE
jgi:hypothetical protein